MARAFLIVLCLALIPSVEAFDWHKGDGYRWRPLKVTSQRQRPGFTRMNAESLGISFTNRLDKQTAITNQIYLNGAGVAVGDVEGDGWPDIYFCGLDGPNALFKNLGNWEFEEVTAEAGISCSQHASTGACFADIDGDDDPDLIVTTIHEGPLLYLNDGSGRFTRHTEEAGLDGGAGSMSIATADINGDGYLDIYIANYRASTLRDMPQTKFEMQVVEGQPKITRVNGRPVTAPDLVGRFTVSREGEITEHGRKDALFLNDGDGSFTRVPFTGGFFLDAKGDRVTRPPYDWGLSVMFQDVNQDMRPDIYVCNDFSAPDRLWINTGHGFKAVSKLSLRHTSRFSMGVDFSDINRDGLKDFFVADMLSRRNPRRQSQFIHIEPEVTEIGEIDNRPQYIRNSLFLKRSGGFYAEISAFAGLEATEWSWSTLFLDVDLDGYEDLLVTNGHARDAQNADIVYALNRIKRRRALSPKEEQRLVTEFPRLEATNLVYRNVGGLRFEEMGDAWGFARKGISHGMALGDLDRDGDADGVINNLNKAPGIYRNGAVAPRIAVRLKGTSPNTDAIGAKIRVRGGPVPQSEEVIGGGRYLSSDGPTQTFAAGSETNRLRIEVLWRDGERSVVSNVVPNRVYEIYEEGPQKMEESPIDKDEKTPEPSETTSPYFRDVSARLGHRHHEEGTHDFKEQPLLPKRLSRMGPGLGWMDWNRDGWIDLVIGAGKGGHQAIYLNDTRGGLERLKGGTELRLRAEEDQTGVIGVRPEERAPTLFYGSYTAREGGDRGRAVNAYSRDEIPEDKIWTGYRGNTGPLAATDLTGHGELSLFAGGLARPGQYPLSAPSFIFRRDENGWRLDLENTKRLQGIGPVNGAVFSDLNGDGFPDLVLACDWGPIRVFRNDEGTLQEVTAKHGLDKFLGWWNGVATGDFDSDGRPDIVASNWGKNTKYEKYRHHPLRLYHGEIGRGPGRELIEAHFDRFLKKWVPERSLRVMTNAIPALASEHQSFVEYGRKSMREIFGERLSNMERRQVGVLESMVFLNREGGFEAKPLPSAAQFAPAFGVVVGDYNGDGHEDIFLAQNFFSWGKSAPRSDAGRGLWLRGNGKGEFESVSAKESGVRIYGEQRGAALADYNRDGRVDLAVAQNGRATKLFRNQKADRGLRVRLKGPPGNPDALGAQIRIEYKTRHSSPVKEIQAGSGYWSQNSPWLVLGLNGEPKGLWIRWPGGKIERKAVAQSSDEVVVPYSL